MEIIIPQIPVSKGLVREDNEDFMMHLRPSSFFGNLNLKFWDYHNRHVYLNHLLWDIYTLHTLEKQFINGSEYYSLNQEHSEIIFKIESLIYWLRKNTDELIAFHYYYHFLHKNKREPEKLTIFSIGTLLGSKGHHLYKLFGSHISKLKLINDISNTYKHSFITSEAHRLMGRSAPAVNCFDLSWNDTANEPVFHSYYLSEIVDDYCNFFEFAGNSLKVIDVDS